ncbi:Serine/threonine-protein kinase PknB [Sandaracinus amylolyticus]|nr:Serine/threonine-protein kinase PknB [Sandaracinus amylolyticus]
MLATERPQTHNRAVVQGRSGSGFYDRLMTRLGLGTVDFAISQDRDLTQRRLALFLALVGGLEVTLWVLQASVLAVFDTARLSWMLQHYVAYLHLVLGCSLLGLSRLVRSRPWRYESLQLFDAGVVVGLGVVFGSLPSLGQAQWRPELAGLLAISFLLFVRSAIVPSDTTRTGVLGVIVCIPIVLSTYLVHTQPGRPADWPPPALFVAGTLVWAFAAIKASSVVSHVIYGLHRQVREALTLGQYTLEEKIGEGGMGVVYRARHALMRRPTAIKLLRAERGPQAIARFEREVQMTSRLTHPNTIAIYDYGHTPDGIFYYVMEHLDGFDLEHVVRAEGPMHPGRVVHVLRQAAEALGEAHALGLIHRDVKPGNLLLCERGGRPDFVKVLDFGLVREIDGGAPAFSQTEALQGTPLYMSPEQIREPHAIDGRSDVYSLGAVAYFLLTGEPVFEGKNVVEVCGHHLHSHPVRPSVRVGRPLPEKLEALVMRCLEKDPAARPSSAAALIELLEACDVPEWTDADARQWWRERAPELRRSSSERHSARPVTLAVDLDKRNAA